MELQFKNTKIHFIDHNIVRIEYSPSEEFSNKPTILVNYKKEIEKQYKVSGDKIITITFDCYSLIFDKNNPLFTLIVKKNDKVVFKYKGLSNSGVLPVPNKTPVVFPLMDSPKIYIPDEGYSAGANFKVDKFSKDLYLLFCENDFKVLRQQYISLTGKNNMPRKKYFGLWHSRYHKYSDAELKELISEYSKHKIPLDILVVDTDWREGLGSTVGVGYNIDTKLFPNMEEFIHYCHKHNAEVMFNDHPMPLTNKTTVFDKDEIKYRVDNLTNLLGIGLDAWWYDRNWIVSLKSSSKKIRHETLGNYLFNDIETSFLKNFSLDPDFYTRPVTMNNIVNIENGLNKSILDSNSHRYTIQWSGDIPSEGWVIKNEIGNMIKCSNSMIGYYSSDIGGHLGNPSKEEYIRWVQLGAFEPVDRPHCSCTCKPSREPWNYDEETLDIAKHYIDMRYRLSNVFYTEAFKHVDSGLGICKPLSFEYPFDKKANKITSEYLLGSDILVAPVSGNQIEKLTRKDYYGLVYASFFNNDECKGKPLFNEKLKTVDFTFDKKHKYNGLLADKFSVKLRFKIRFKHDVYLYISSTNPMKIYLASDKIYDADSRYSPLPCKLCKLDANKVYTIRMKYVQNKAHDELAFLFANCKEANKKQVYLPEGNWFAINEQRMYKGPFTLNKQYKLNEMPLFVKEGALLPMYKKVTNLSLMKLEDIIYDYYTSKNIKNNNFFYEDDGETTGYLIGVNRKNNFETKFENNKYVVTLFKSIDHLFDGLKTRNAMMKVHLQDYDYVKDVKINGESIAFKKHKRHPKAYAFNPEGYAKDSRTVEFKFKQDIKADTIIEIILEDK